MVIPAAKKKRQDAEPSAPVPKPQLPDSPVSEANASHVIRDIVAWATPKLLEFATKNGFAAAGDGLAGLLPLQFEDKSSKLGNLASTYKEVWSVPNCHQSLVNEALYEAGGSLFWVDMYQPGEEITWQQVVATSSLFEPKILGSGKHRIVWPFTLECTCLKGQNPVDHYPGSLSLCHGHLAIWGWWKLLFDALSADDQDQQLRLLECALTCTVQLRAVASEAERLAVAWLLFFFVVPI